MINQGRWLTLQNYPYGTLFFGNCAVVYHDGAFYLFGGLAHPNPFSKTIARLDVETKTWSRRGFRT